MSYKDKIARRLALGQQSKKVTNDEIVGFLKMTTAAGAKLERRVRIAAVTGVGALVLAGAALVVAIVR